MPVDLGVIFDADGVLLDSEPQSYAVLDETLATASGGRIRLSPDLAHFVSGRDDRSVVLGLNERFGTDMDPVAFTRDKDARYERIVSRSPVRVFPGVFELIDRLESRAVPHAVATSASRAKLDCSLRSAGLTGRFDAIVSADDVAAAKPDPAIFLLAAERLGLAPERIVVFEDTPNGVQAANRARMISVAIPNTFPESDLKKASMLLGSLESVTVDWLEKLVNDLTP